MDSDANPHQKSPCRVGLVLAVTSSSALSLFSNVPCRDYKDNVRWDTPLNRWHRR